MNHVLIRNLYDRYRNRLHEGRHVPAESDAPRNEVDGILTKYIKPFTYDGLEIKYHKIS